MIFDMKKKNDLQNRFTITEDFNMKKVMITDDSAFSRNILRQIVESGNYRVIEAANGAEAIALFKTEKPDAVTMDLLMPDMDGIDAVKKILETDPEAKIIVSSTDKQKFRKQEAKEAGALAFVSKPVDPDEILGTLKNILGE